VRYFNINNYLIKTIKTSKTIINLNNEKKPFLFIINVGLSKIKSKNFINNKNSIKKKLIFFYPIHLPFYLKHSYFKKKIKS
jgi:hypothetical protein